MPLAAVLLLLMFAGAAHAAPTAIWYEPGPHRLTLTRAMVFASHEHYTVLDLRRANGRVVHLKVSQPTASILNGERIVTDLHSTLTVRVRRSGRVGAWDSFFGRIR